MDPTLLQALISGGGAVLGGLLGSAGTYLIAKKKLRQDASLHLYQKQLDACSELFFKSQVLIEALGDAGSLGPKPDEGQRFSELIGQLKRSQFYLPANVINALWSFCSYCEEARSAPLGPFYNFSRDTAEQRLSEAITVARDEMGIDPLGELVAVKQPEKDQSQHESSGHVDKVG